MKNTHAAVDNHHLSIIIILLTAILLSLGIYTFFYSNRTARIADSSKASGSAATAAALTPDTATGSGSFTGTISSIRGQSQMTVSSVVITDGALHTKTYIVNFTRNTPVTSLMESADDPSGAAVEQITASTSALSVGTAVQVYTEETVGTTSPLTASAIVILPS